MPTYRVSQSKPLVAIGSVFGVAVLVAGALSIGFRSWIIWIWLAFGAGIIAFNLWSAFGPRGHDQVVESDPMREPPTNGTGGAPAVVSYRVRPSRGLALLVATGAAVILVVGSVSMLRVGGAPAWFAVMFIAAGVFIVGGTLWSGFAPNGHIQTIRTTSDVPPPVRRGHVAVRQ